MAPEPETAEPLTKSKKSILDGPCAKGDEPKAAKLETDSESPSFPELWSNKSEAKLQKDAANRTASIQAKPRGEGRESELDDPRANSVEPKLAVPETESERLTRAVLCANRSRPRLVASETDRRRSRQATPRKGKEKPGCIRPVMSSELPDRAAAFNGKRKSKEQSASTGIAEPRRRHREEKAGIRASLHLTQTVPNPCRKLLVVVARSLASHGQ